MMRTTFRNLCLLISFGLCMPCIITAQERRYTVANAHAHNDYIHPVPFYPPYHAGFGSIEADIFLRNNELYVAHDTTQIQSHRTLEKLYLAPLNELIGSNKGFVFSDTSKNLMLLIDLKTAALPTLDKLIQVLKKYPALTSCASLHIVITGGQPPPVSFATYPSWISFDGQLDKNYTPEAFQKVALFSDNFRNYSKWNGKGVPVAADYQKLKAAVSRSHALNKPIRFWASPDGLNAWYTLMRLDVDYINTDKIFEITSFMNRLPAVSFTSVAPQSVYRPTFKHDRKVGPVTSVIFLIGDGMGLAQLYSAYTANRGGLNIFNMRSIGLAQTAATDSYITDSGGGGTALATGNKTANRHIGVDSSGRSLVQLTAVATKRGMRTGIITTGDIADATPASFYAHHPERDSLVAIAGDFPTSAVDLLIGSGKHYFNNEKGRKALQQNGISRHNSVNEIFPASKRLLVLDDNAALTINGGRGKFLSHALSKSLSYLSSGKRGFFLMAEGAKIDLGGHQNNMAITVTELLDFDAAVGQAMQWADQHPGTLVVVTGDHETGGVSLMDGDLKKGYVSGHFSTDDHTGIPVPVFAYGPQSDRFAGVYQNTELFLRIVALLK